MITTDSIENSCVDNAGVTMVFEASRADRVIAVWEIASVTVSFLTAEWIILPFGTTAKIIGTVPLFLGFATMIVSHLARNESTREIGFRLDNFQQAIGKLAVPMLLYTLVLLAIGWSTDGFKSNKFYVWQWIIWLPLWGFVQQYALQGFMNRRAQLVFGKGILSSLTVAFIFSVLHLPNPWLTIATFIGGLIWATVYQKAPNLFALALSHSFMTLVLVFALPQSLLKSLRVGLRYFS